MVTRDKVRFSGTVDYLQLPGWEGEMGILRNHAPLIAVLRPGEAMARAEGHDYYMAIGDGFVKIFENTVLVLVSFALTPDEVNVQEKEALIKEEEKYLRDHADDPSGLEIHRKRIADAKACIAVAGRSREPGSS